jgi:hypothetical protein
LIEQGGEIFPIPAEAGSVGPANRQAGVRTLRDQRLRRALKRVPGLQAAVYSFRWWRREVNAVVYGVVGKIGNLVAPSKARERFHGQAVLRQPSPLPAGPAWEAMVAALEGKGIRFTTEAVGIYIPRQPELETVLGEIVNVYPRDTTFKVSQNGESPHATVLVANLLHEHGLGPRVYDAFSLDVQDRSFTVQVIDERESIAPAPDKRAEVIAGVSDLVKAGDLAIVRQSWLDPEHFRGSVTSDGVQARYVGFENFVVPDPARLTRKLLDKDARSDLHFGTEYKLKGRRYLYQSVPGVHATGRRNSLRRWRKICSMLGDTGVTLDDRVVLDVGCNAGMMLAASLSDGALWGLGWDFPTVIKRSRELMLASGYTRFDLFGRELTADYSLLDDIPGSLHSRLPGAVVLYLAVRHNTGFFVSGLADIPWETLVYEGGEEESVATLEESLSDLRKLCDFRVADAIDFRDGETGSRPLAVLVRS